MTMFISILLLPDVTSITISLVNDIRWQFKNKLKHEHNDIQKQIVVLNT